MTGLDQLAAALSREFPAGLTGLRRHETRELRCAVEAGAVPGQARWLRVAGGAELILMIGADRRRDAGRFEVHYLFAHSRENWFVHATLPVAADRPEIPSLATFHYPASRFERELFDVLGIRAVGHPDPRPLVRHAFWPADYFPLRQDAVADVVQATVAGTSRP